MKKQTRIVWFLLAVMLFALLFGCASKKPPKLGTYMTEDRMATLILEENNEFLLFGSPMVSFAPSGEYSVKDGKVYLALSTDIEGEDGYVFSMGDDLLIFEKGAWLEHWIEPGAILYLSE